MKLLNDQDFLMNHGKIGQFIFAKNRDSLQDYSYLFNNQNNRKTEGNSAKKRCFNELILYFF